VTGDTEQWNVVAYHYCKGCGGSLYLKPMVAPTGHDWTCICGRRFGPADGYAQSPPGVITIWDERKELVK
jgi:hypothetical protein